MKRGEFLRALAVVVAMPLFASQPAAAAVPKGRPATQAELDYLALDVAIHVLNERGPQFITPPDDKFWPYIYARLGEMGVDTSWDTAKQLRGKFYGLRDEMLNRANTLKKGMV
jgi:hypothetical protein